MTENEIFKSVDFNKKVSGLESTHYLDCYFENCTLPNLNLSHIIFEDCTFISCDLSNAKLGETSFKNIIFEKCKMLGLQFNDCRSFLLEVHTKECLLDYCSFIGLSLKSWTFQTSSMIEADFSEADLEKVSFDNCDLLRATFEQTNLKMSDFRTARNYSFNPENNTISKAKFSFPHAVGLLSKYDIIIEG